MTQAPRVLLVEDEPTALLALGDALEDAGYDLVCTADGGRARSLLASTCFDLMVADVRLPGCDGYELAREALDKAPPVAVILMTAFGEVDRAVEMLKLGVRDYLTKPFSEEELLERVAKVVQELAARPPTSDQPVAESQAMRELLTLACRVARTDATVMILGETGVGKEVVARYVHGCSPRHGGSFVAANCAAIPGELIESEMFGHLRGAFTGATSARRGWLRSAHGGSLFLDEVGELSQAAQAKLLRALETHTVTPVGADKPEAADFRLITASNRSLDEQTATGSFRLDLLYRLNVFELTVPPLRERPEDVGPLVGHFLEELRKRAEDVPMGITSEALELMSVYSWPGNVRELRNAVDHAAILAGAGRIQPEHLPPKLRGQVGAEDPLNLKQSTDRLQARQIRAALGIALGRRARAAELLGVSRKHLWELMKRHGIEV